MLRLPVVYFAKREFSIPNVWLTSRGHGFILTFRNLWVCVCNFIFANCVEWEKMLNTKYKLIRTIELNKKCSNTLQ